MTAICGSHGALVDKGDPTLGYIGGEGKVEQRGAQPRDDAAAHAAKQHAGQHTHGIGHVQP